MPGMDALSVEHKSVRSFDGTSIAYQVLGDGPAVVMANGLGGTYTTWRHQMALFSPGYKVISWDYRGLFRSARPPRLETLAIDSQVADLEAVLAAEGVNRALMIGWSMGVQVVMEYYRKHPEQFVGIVVLNGVAGLPFQTALGTPLVAHVMPLLTGLMKVSGPLVAPVARLAARWKHVIPLFQAIGMAAPSLDPAVFYDLVEEYATLDFEAYGETLRYLGKHDAGDLLHRITVPTLIVTGSRDLFTPLATAQHMAATIPDARLEVVQGGTHYTAVEFPGEVNAHIRAFVRRLGYGRMGAD